MTAAEGASAPQAAPAAPQPAPRPRRGASAPQAAQGFTVPDAPVFPSDEERAALAQARDRAALDRLAPGSRRIADKLAAMAADETEE